MNMVYRTGLVAMTLLAVPAVSAAQVADVDGSRAEVSAQRGGGGPWLPSILRNAPELNLSSDQVVRLEGIERGLRERNEPLLAQLREARERSDGRGGVRDMTPEARERLRRDGRSGAGAATPEQRQRMAERLRRGVPAELQPVMRQVRQNAAEATREARAVLTPEQLAQARELVRSHVLDRSDRPFQRRGSWTGPTRRAR